jgi:hypothetical protein
VAAGSGNEAKRLELLYQHRNQIVEQLSQLHECLELIDAKVASYERHLAAGAGGDPWQPEPT